MSRFTGNQSISPAKAAQTGGTSTPGASPPSTAEALNSKPITAQEIIELMRANPEGISLSALLSKFRGRVGDKPGQMKKSEWINLVRRNVGYGPDKLLRPKLAPTQAAAQPSAQDGSGA